LDHYLANDDKVYKEKVSQKAKEFRPVMQPICSDGIETSESVIKARIDRLITELKMKVNT
jgi:hypothetical protein